jgi:NADPH2:quinone reductase
MRLMRAVEISHAGGPDVLRVVERPTPAPGTGEVLIKVKAAGVNRPDIMQRLGKYPPPPGASDIPGLEVAGTIESRDSGSGVRDSGSGVRDSGSGVRDSIDAVCALVAGGGYAEYCVAPRVQCLPIPNGLDFAQAAAIPETFFTVWTNVFQRGGLKPGERILVHGGTSGIGTTAIQLARAFGATVFATAGSDEKCHASVEIGAARAINYRTEDFVQVVRDETEGHGVDVVLDIVGADYLQRNLDCLALHGRLVQIGLISGARGEIDLRTILQRRLTLTGSTLRPRTVEEKGALARDVHTNVWPLLEAGTVRPLVWKTYPLDEAADAHRALEAGEVIGKAVLTV